MDWWGSVYTYNGISWSSLDSIDPGYPGLESVSCPTTRFCAAVDYSDVFTYSSMATPKTALKLSAAMVTYGDEGVEHLTVTVSPQHSGSTPTGTVTIKTSTTTLCVIKLSSCEESCTLYAKKLKAGTYTLVATYGRCGRRDSNPHPRRDRDLNPARLPIPPRPRGSSERTRD